MSSAKLERQQQKGVAMVEFAIALPLLLLLLLGIGEFGRMLFQYNVLLQASRDAARYAAGEAWDPTLGQVVIDDDLRSRTRLLAVYGVPVAVTGGELVGGLSTGNVAVTPVGDEHVQVSIVYDFVPVIGSVLPTFYGADIPLAVTLTSSVVMRGL
ncbi:pilus assembly protein [Pseudomonas sp. L-22-4S-12]|uniref:TadE/TadG family type IV pilus assembly protein n=1 Tax=Pseudomonas sp. L-22-4S-12 TaxID=2610893 RepID=UPI001326FE66|nr:TadE/TadG family type IV pilus assembly protein [Pseudomonas sp. L-22-4S-12]MWV16771.1 pilus assembly protein [Pseudomonas sp. L-22-4S-12]